MRRGRRQRTIRNKLKGLPLPYQLPGHPANKSPEIKRYCVEKYLKTVNNRWGRGKEQVGRAVQ